MYPVELLAIDLDGTLLDSKSRVPDRNRAALHRLHEQGVHVVLCTGRALAETRPVMEQIGLDLDAVVTCSGAVVSDARSGLTLTRTVMEARLAHRLAGWMISNNVTPLWLVDADTGCVDGWVVPGAARHPAVDRWVMKTPCRIDRLAELSLTVPAPVRLVLIDEEPVLERLSIEMTEQFPEELTFNILRAPSYDLSVLETFAAGVSKWAAVRWLCDRWNIATDRVAAIGDDVNDLEMVQNAGVGIAMANARPIVRAAARRLTLSNDEAGVAAAIDEIVFATRRAVS